MPREAPILAIELDDGAACKARQIRRKVKSGGRPHRPVHEIDSRILGVGVAIEIIPYCEAPDRDRNAIDIAFSCQLVRSVSDVLPLASQSKCLPEKIPLRPKLGKVSSAFLRFAIRKARQAQCCPDTESLCQFRIEVELATFPKPPAQKRVNRPGFPRLTAARQAIRPLVG